MKCFSDMCMKYFSINKIRSFIEILIEFNVWKWYNIYLYVQRNLISLQDQNGNSFLGQPRDASEVMELQEKWIRIFIRCSFRHHLLRWGFWHIKYKKLLDLFCCYASAHFSVSKPCGQPTILRLIVEPNPNSVVHPSNPPTFCLFHHPSLQCYVKRKYGHYLFIRWNKWYSLHIGGEEYIGWNNIHKLTS